MQVNKIIKIYHKNFLSQNSEKTTHPSLEKRKIVESLCMGAGMGLVTRAGGSAKEALVIGASVGVLHYWFNDWDKDIYNKYKSSEENQVNKQSDKSDEKIQNNSFLPLIFGSFLFIVSAGAGIALNKGKVLKDVIAKSGIQALSLTGALHIIMSTASAIKNKNNKNQNVEITEVSRMS